MNKIVVITGASSGIGLCLYKMYEEKGDIPICLARTNDAGLKNFYECNVTSEEMIISCFKQIQKQYKNIDILINNAGFGISGAVELASSSTVEHLMNVNFMGAFLCYKYALPLMQSGAKVVNISSVCALFPIDYRGFYCASKSALSSLSFTEYMELKKSNISVITICPGQTKSNFNKNRIRNLETNERYGETISSAAETLKQTEEKRMPTEYVAKIILKQTYKKYPKPMKIIGFKYKFFYFAYKILPLKWFLNLTHKFLGK